MEPNPHTPRPRFRTLPKNEHAGVPRAVPRRGASGGAPPPTPRTGPGPAERTGGRAALDAFDGFTNDLTDGEIGGFRLRWGVTPESFALSNRLFMGFCVYYRRLCGVFRKVAARSSR